VLEHEPHKIAANKPTPARNQKTHRRQHVSDQDLQRQRGNPRLGWWPPVRRISDPTAIRMNHAATGIKRLHFDDICLVCIKKFFQY
jgi:hypothetical protein